MFELRLVSGTPLTSVEDPEEIALTFLDQIGYLPNRVDPKSGATSVKESIPFRLFMECFLRRMDKVWTVEELATYLDTTKPSIYRYIKKLKGLELLEEGIIEIDGTPKKGYKIRYGDLSKAWNFVEAHIEMAMENYRKSVDHLQSMLGD